MILETATFDVKPDMTAQFEAGVAAARPVFARAKGCHGVSLRRLIETSTTYLLMIEWETLADHTVAFRESADFQVWRSLVGPCFANAPTVVHSTGIDLDAHQSA